MAQVIELAPGQWPDGDEERVLVHVTNDIGVATTGNVIIHTGGITFQTLPTEPELSLNIEHARDAADKRGIGVVYVQRDAR